MTQFQLVPVEPTREMLEAVLGPVKPQYENRRDLRPMIYRAMLAAAPSPWVSVEDDLPKAEEDSTESASVIVCLNDLVRTTGFYCHVENEWYGEDGYSFEEASNGPVTRWMPLPPPPTRQERNE